MSNVNFRKTAKGYSADYQRRDGFGLERRFFHREDIMAIAKHYGWQSADEQVPGEGWTVAEMLIVLNSEARPFRVVNL